MSDTIKVDESTATDINAALDAAVSVHQDEKSDGPITEALGSDVSKPTDTKETFSEPKANVDAIVEAPTATAIETPEVVGEPAKTTISRDTLERAIRAGIPMDEAEAFQKEETLLKIVARLEAANPTIDSKNVVSESKVDSVNDQFVQLRLDPEKYEEDVVAQFDKVINVLERQQKEIDAFKSSATSLAQITQDAKMNEAISWFDSQVAKLGPDFKDALGEGSIKSLQTGSAQHIKREQLANQIAVQLTGCKAIGLPVPPREQVFDAAAQIVLKGEYTKANERKLSSELEARGSQVISRPTNGSGTSTQSATDEIASLLDNKFFSK